MMPRRLTIVRSLILASFFAALLMLCGNAAAQHPSNPTFSGTSDLDLLTHSFVGVFRQGGPGATLNFSVFNRAAPSGTTAPMSLVGTDSLGHTTSMVLQTGTVSGLPPGGSSPMSLVLNTSQPGNLSVSYTLEFASDGMPTEPHQNLAIGAYATVYRRGDYDLDHDVDNADYSLWRGSVGSNSAETDGNENGIVDAADYVVWRDNFTGPLGGGEAEALSANLSALATPEPSSWALAMLCAGLASLFSPRRRPPVPSHAADDFGSVD